MDDLTYGARTRGMLPLKDALLLSDWKDELYFNAYENCEQEWTADQGYVRYFQLRGQQKRLYGQFAAKSIKPGSRYKWMPAIIDTGARGIYLCNKTLKSLGIDPCHASASALTVKIGEVAFPDVRVTEEQGQTTDGSNLSGDVNILGIDFLGEGLVVKVHEVIKLRIGDPTLLSKVMVTDGKVSFMVAPEMPKVFALKKAIVEYMRYDLAPPLAIKSPDGTVLGDEDDLSPGMKYTFVLPPK